ncbi:hypothetical protein L1049_010488 [Liquidambar formosana]|uniref:RING-type E3 ubiquitin transferase n=1 Tax=Liquidambar formosana TaxID=63359 RepID=A0AAP0R4F6_LIQFO
MGAKDDDDPSPKFGVSRKIMLAAIISLLIVTILIIFLHLYSRYLLRRRERQRRQASLYPLTTQVTAADEVTSIDLSKTGLHPSIIALLPIFTYKSTHRLDHGEPTECSVCLSTIVEEATVRVLPNCKHMFHAECVDMWLSSHVTCPICRTTVEPGVQQLHEHSELGTGVVPTAPPLEVSGPDGGVPSEKVGGSCSRLSSFRRMLSRERSSRRVQSCEEVGVQDVERQ